ncbi:MAG: sdhD [Burkholderiales bacterium]|jgi:succinate dehydrogenase / fumarate reductase membrane anchor subunit|nr:sdhD [Burkholderiales bacterium]
MVNRSLTGAGYGLGSWLQQRVTAVIMLFSAIVFFIFIAYLALHVNSGISSWQSVFQNIFVKIFVQIFFIALVLHAWVGIRDLWMDYVNSAGARLVLYSFTILWLLGSLIYSIKILWV